MAWWWSDILFVILSVCRSVEWWREPTSSLMTPLVTTISSDKEYQPMYCIGRLYCLSYLIQQPYRAETIVSNIVWVHCQSWVKFAATAAWSTLIGRGMSRLCSHWCRVATPALLCHKEPAQRMQNTPILLFASLWIY